MARKTFPRPRQALGMHAHRRRAAATAGRFPGGRARRLQIAVHPYGVPRRRKKVRSVRSGPQCARTRRRPEPKKSAPGRRSGTGRPPKRVTRKPRRRMTGPRARGRLRKNPTPPGKRLRRRWERERRRRERPRPIQIRRSHRPARASNRWPGMPKPPASFPPRRPLKPTAWRNSPLSKGPRQMPAARQKVPLPPMARAPRVKRLLSRCRPRPPENQRQRLAGHRRLKWTPRLQRKPGRRFP